MAYIQGVKKVMDPKYGPFHSIFLLIFEIFTNHLTKLNNSKLLVEEYRCKSGLSHISDHIRAPKEVKIPIMGDPLLF